jgi:hypothetical protein
MSQLCVTWRFRAHPPKRKGARGTARNPAWKPLLERNLCAAAPHRLTIRVAPQSERYSARSEARKMLEAPQAPRQQGAAPRVSPCGQRACRQTGLRGSCPPALPRHPTRTASPRARRHPASAAPRSTRSNAGAPNAGARHVPSGVWHLPARARHRKSHMIYTAGTWNVPSGAWHLPARAGHRGRGTAAAKARVTARA